jgi:hypothetical protein
MFSSCGTTPIAARALRASRSISMPQMLALPDVLTTSPARILISVDLPAPFGPSSPNSEPRGIAKSTLSNAGLASCLPPLL